MLNENEFLWLKRFNKTLHRPDVSAGLGEVQNNGVALDQGNVGLFNIPVRPYWVLPQFEAAPEFYCVEAAYAPVYDHLFPQ